MVDALGVGWYSGHGQLSHVLHKRSKWNSNHAGAHADI